MHGKCWLSGECVIIVNVSESNTFSKLRIIRMDEKQFVSNAIRQAIFSNPVDKKMNPPFVWHFSIIEDKFNIISWISFNL